MDVHNIVLQCKLETPLQSFDCDVNVLSFLAEPVWTSIILFYNVSCNIYKMKFKIRDRMSKL
jgi:hypothetical protein